MINMKSLFLVGLIATTLPACQASPVAPAAPEKPAAAQRHLLLTAAKGMQYDAKQQAYYLDSFAIVNNQAAGTGNNLWGINFTRDAWTRTEGRSSVVDATGYTLELRSWLVHEVSYATSGAGDFTYVGNGRIDYTVPHGKKLVINELNGGSVRINGLMVGTDATTATGNLATGATYQTQTRLVVRYEFGQDEDVVFQPTPGCSLVGYTTGAEDTGAAGDGAAK